MVTETELLQQIDLGLSHAQWQEYFALLRKQDVTSLTKAEHQRIGDIAKLLEDANVRRIEALAQLAQIRNTTLDALMAEFNIGPLNYDNSRSIFNDT